MQAGQIDALPETAPVVVRREDDRLWSVCLGDQIILTTADADQAFEVGCRSRTRADGSLRALLLLSGPSARDTSSPLEDGRPVEEGLPSDEQQACAS